MIGSKYWKFQTAMPNRAKTFISILILSLLFIGEVLNFFTKMISEKSSTKSTTQKIFLRTLCFCAWLPVKGTITCLKSETFRISIAHSHLYEWLAILLNPVFHGLSFGIKFIRYPTWHHSATLLAKGYAQPGMRTF